MKQIWQKIFFSNMTPLVELGKSRPLETTDIVRFTDEISHAYAKSLFADVNPIHVAEGSKAPRKSVLRFMLQIMSNMKRHMVSMYLLAFGFLACELAGPVVLNKILTLLESPSNGANYLMKGSVFAVAFGLLGLTGGILGQHYIFKFLKIGRLVTRGMNEQIYATSLKLTRCARQRYPIGDIVNLMASDCDSLQDFVWAKSELVMSIVSIVTATGLMVHFLGRSGFIAAGILVVLIPITKSIASRYCLYGDDISKARDLRTAYLSQALSSIRVVKSFGWESLVAERIRTFRNQEVLNRKKFVTISGLSIIFYQLIGTFVGALVFGSMIYFGHDLSAAKLFTAMALIGLMEGPFDRIPQLISMMSQAFVSAERIGTFLGTETISIQRVASPADLGSIGFEFRNANLKFADATQPVITDLKLRVTPGSAVAIVGPVGGGKSTLLSALLGEVEVQKDELSFFTPNASSVPAHLINFAYVPQEAFIQNASLRDNISFGDSNLDLSEPIWASCLDHDIQTWPAGIDTEIGEHGVNLSGGQKQRVALARAAAQKPAIALLDDPLSALDENTESKLMDRLIFGLWADKTRIVVTHRLRHLARFDRILFIENGSLIAEGSLPELLVNSARFSQFYFECESTSSQNTNKKVSDLEANQESNGAPPEPTELSLSKASLSDPSDDMDLARITENEDRQYGSVLLRHYKSYMTAMVSPCRSYSVQPISRSSYLARCSILMLIVVLATLGPILVNSWIAAWGETLDRTARGITTSAGAERSLFSPVSYLSEFVSASPLSNLYVYSGLALGSAFLVWLQYYIYGVGGIRAGQNFHDAMLNSVLGARLRFFDATPIGRILNRFAKDLDSIERHLPWRFESTIRTFLSMLSQLALITLLLPMTAVVTAPMMYLYFRLQRGYRASSRETQRLDSASRSPRFSHFKETLMGLDVIRAFAKQDSFSREFHRKITENQQMFLGVVMLNRWYSLRVALAASVLSLSIALCCVYAVGFGWIFAGTAGLALVYGLRFWESLNWSVRVFVELESGMTSVERVSKFVEIPQERDLPRSAGGSTLVHGASVRESSPIVGASITFTNVKMRYAPHLPLILRGLTFSIKAGERVGIIGRTGAGKSSIFHALYRFSDLAEGDIHINGKSISSMPLSELRQGYATVPQDPILFMGRLRDSIDPFGQFEDQEIWQALDRVHLAERIRRLGGEGSNSSGLDVIIAENGLNLSQGERQLICLARAILTGAQIILMDEATSAIDVETDAQIQSTIRHAFKGRTIIMIAHRLETIADCDQIIEIKDGRLDKTWINNADTLQLANIQKSPSSLQQSTGPF